MRARQFGNQACEDLEHFMGASQFENQGYDDPKA